MKKTLSFICIVLCLIITASLSVSADDIFTIDYDYGVAAMFSDNVTNSNPQSYTKGQQISLTAPVCDGFEFAGWYLESDYSTPVSSPDTSSGKDITLYAKWYEMTYNISYVLETPGIDLKNEEITNLNSHSRLASESTYLTAPVCNTDVYTFDGWYTDSTYTNKVTYIDAFTCSDITLYAKWVNTYYPVHYEMGVVSQSVYTSENNNPDRYEFSEELLLLDASTSDPFYTFDGWYTDEFFTQKAEKIEAGTTGRIVLYAKWIVKSFNITYVLTDDSGISEDVIHNYNPESFEANSGVTLSSPITDDKNFEFDGWYTSPDFDEKACIEYIHDNTNKDITLYAKWSQAVYTISYDYGIVNQIMLPITNPNPTEYHYGDKTVFTDVEADGFIFNGWCRDAKLKEKLTELPDDVFGDITLYADFTEKTYSISYVLDYAEVTASQVVNKNETVRTTTQRVELNEPQTINKDYKFGGWYLDSDYTQKTEAISGYTTGNITLYAKWIKNVVYLPCWGDATLSEQLSAADARLILRYSSGLETGFSELQKKVSDINNDGKVNAADARLALRLSANLDTEYELKKQYSLPTIKVVDGEVVFK